MLIKELLFLLADIKNTDCEMWVFIQGSGALLYVAWKAKLGAKKGYFKILAAHKTGSWECTVHIKDKADAYIFINSAPFLGSNEIVKV